jgi:hypothetical protein
MICAGYADMTGFFLKVIQDGADVCTKLNQMYRKLHQINTMDILSAGSFA